MLKLGVFTVMLPDLTPEQAAEALATYGYAGVEWRVTQIPAERQDEPPSFWGNNRCTFAPTLEEAERARKIARDAGLAIPGLGTYLSVGDLQATETAMQFAKACGAPQIRVPSGGLPEATTYAEQFEAAKRYLAEVEPMAKAYGVKAVVEIHHGTITPSASLAYRLVSHFDPQYIGVIHDAGNMVHEGFEDYRLGVQLLGDYLAHVHVKNAAYGGDHKAKWSPLENGVVDFGRLFSALKEVGYSGWIVVEDFSNARTSLATLEHNISFLREIMGRVW